MHLPVSHSHLKSIVHPKQYPHGWDLIRPRSDIAYGPTGNLRSQPDWLPMASPDREQKTARIRNVLSPRSPDSRAVRRRVGWLGRQTVGASSHPSSPRVRLLSASEQVANLFWLEWPPRVRSRDEDRRATLAPLWPENITRLHTKCSLEDAHWKHKYNWGRAAPRTRRWRRKPQVGPPDVSRMTRRTPTQSCMC